MNELFEWIDAWSWMTTLLVFAAAYSGISFIELYINIKKDKDLK